MVEIPVDVYPEEPETNSDGFKTPLQGLPKPSHAIAGKTVEEEELAVPRLTAELSSPFPQARSQALHTLSKIRDPRARPFITPALLHDEEDEVARAAWRAAVVLVVAGEEAALADELATELGRRNRECWRSLTRAFVDLGEDARAPLDLAASSGTFAVRVHAAATLLMLDGLQRTRLAAGAQLMHGVTRPVITRAVDSSPMGTTAGSDTHSTGCSTTSATRSRRRSGSRWRWVGRRSRPRTGIRPDRVRLATHSDLEAGAPGQVVASTSRN